MSSNNFNIFIDFGGVLYGIDINRTIRAFAAYSALPAEKFIEMANNPIFSEYERGLLSTVQFRSRAKELFRLTCSDAQFDDAWNATLISMFDSSVADVKRFKQLGRVFLLSNTNELHLNRFRPECETLFSLFDGLFFSHELGLSKPDHNIFKLAMERTGSAPECSVFIDDTKANTDAAAECGMLSLPCESGGLSSLFHTVKLYAHDCCREQLGQ